MFLMGNLVARVTTTERLGVVAPHPIPEYITYINAFTRGAREFNGDVQVHVEWVDAFSNPPAEVEATNALVAASADVILGLADGTTSLETLEGQTIEGAPVLGIAYGDATACDAAPDHCLSSAYWNWGPLVSRLLEEMQAGTWMPQQVAWEQMDDNPGNSVVYYSDISPALAPGTSPSIGELESELNQEGDQGSIMRPFRGPVLDTEGETKIQGGAYPSDADLKAMCWFVQGVTETDGSAGLVPGSRRGLR